MSLQGRGLVVQSENGVAPISDEAALAAVEDIGPAGLALLAGWTADALRRQPNPSDAELAHLDFLAGNRPSAFKHSVPATYAAVRASDATVGKYFLGIASACASSDAERETVAGLRELFGTGVPRLKDGEPRDGSAAKQDPAVAGETSMEGAPRRPSGWTFGVPGRRRMAAQIGVLVFAAMAVAGSIRAVTMRRQALRGR